MITVQLFARQRKHIGGWIGPDTRPMAHEIVEQKFPSMVAIIGPASNLDVTHNFAFGDATPDMLTSVKSGKLIVTASVSIDQPFDGVGASISIGTLLDPESVMPNTSIMPSEIGTYERAVSQVVSVDQDLHLFISPGGGASTGSGHLYIAIN